MVYFKSISDKKNILKYVCPVKTLVQTFWHLFSWYFEY